MKIFRNPVIVISISSSLLALVISLFIATAGLEGINDKIILNNRSLPILGYSSDVFSVLWILGAIIIINSILIFELYDRNRFISYAISAANIVIALVISVAVYMVISLN